MSKPRILAWCDFVAPTGFGNVAKNLFDDLYKDYDLSIVGINYFGNKRYNTDKYFVYSVSKEDPIGAHRLLTIAEKDQPDIIFLFQDIFHIASIIHTLKNKCPKSKIVTYFPIDGAPFSFSWQNVLHLSDVLITYSDWAIQVIKNAFPQTKKKIHKLYHGIDTEVFYPLTLEQIRIEREKYNWENKFVITNVNRFQPRKAIPLVLRAFSMFAKGYKECKVCGNKMPLNNAVCDLNWCDEELKVVQHPKQDVYLYLHMMAQEYSMGPGKANLLQNHLVNNGFTDKDYSNIIGINSKDIYKDEVPEEEVNKIYNRSNLNITTSTGEGCGLSLLESQACGIPSIAPKNSAIPEVLNGTGTLIKNNAVYSHPMDNGHVRPHVDPFEMCLAIDKYYNEWLAAGKERILYKPGLDNIQNNFLWEDKRQILKDIFKETLKEGD